jgi:DNA topoisomerase-1
LRIAFSQSTYFDAKAQLLSVSKQAFEAKITAYAGQPIATGKDFDSTTGVYKGKENTLLLDEERAKAIVKELSSETFIVEDIQKKPFVTRPSIPFTTSTLQQDAIKKLHISASETMRIAQRLYENGYITYMRTDSPSLSQEGTNAARDLVNQLYGKEYLSPSPRYFAAKSVGAQEAHEAIRPAGERFAVPSETSLSGKDFALYELIWKRTLASQMADAKKATTTVTIKAGNGTFVASGTQIVFPGFIRAYVEGSDDPDAALDDKETLLPAMKAGEECALLQLEEVAHQTKSPARYTEASLVQELEKRGIGRPSTYASIIKTLLDRKYVIKDGPALVPTFMGFAVCQFLESNFPQFIDYDFTSKMEDNLDKIAAGKLDKKVFLNAFYLGEEGLENQNKLQLALDNKVVTKTLRLPQISEENPVMIGPYGPYVVDGEGQFISLPNTWLPGTTTDEDVKTLIAEGKKVHVPVEIGKGPVHGEPVKVMNGRFGPYWQEGDGKSAVRASIPKWVQDAGKSEDLEIASRYLALPRVLGKDEQGNEVLAQKGKYGPYISCNKKTRKLNRLDKDQQLFSITLEEALELLSKEPEKGSGEKAGRGSAKASVIKELGQFEKETVALATGRYGFYLRVGNQNIALPNEYKKDEEKAGALTIDEAVAIIRAKRAKE